MSGENTPMTYNQYTSERTNLFNALHEDQNLRIRAPRSPVSPLSYTSDDEDHENPSYPSASPMPEPPTLMRDLNTVQWNAGYEIFTKLHSTYMTWKSLSYLFPVYMISISVSTIQYFTQHEFYWFCLIMPFTGVLFLNYITHHVLFTNSPCVSRNQLSYYPGRDYEYGSLIKTTHCIDTLYPRSEYQYWVVINPNTRGVDFISVENEQYNSYIKHSVHVV